MRVMRTSSLAVSVAALRAPGAQPCRTGRGGQAGAVPGRAARPPTPDAPGDRASGRRREGGCEKRGPGVCGGASADGGGWRASAAGAPAVRGGGSGDRDRGGGLLGGRGGCRPGAAASRRRGFVLPRREAEAELGAAPEDVLRGAEPFAVHQPGRLSLRQAGAEVAAEVGGFVAPARRWAASFP